MALAMADAKCGGERAQMTMMGKALVLAAAVVLASGVSSGQQAPRTKARGDSSHKADGSAARRVDEIFAELNTPGNPGAAVMVRKDGRTVLQRGYGVRSLKSGEQIDAQTNFRLASCTKQFTAMAVMLLVRDGKLRYDENLREVFPEFPEYGKRITVRNLLNHTGGLPDYEDLMEKVDPLHARWTEERQISDREVLKLLEAESSAKFAPGTKWSYSNSGYVVLGLVVARATGQPFDEFLRARIFAPLKMAHTLAYVKGKNEVQRRAYGHSTENGGFAETDQSSTSATLGDGGVYSNLADLARWDGALARHTLLSAAEMRPALRAVRLADGAEPRWASGPGDTDPLAGKPVAYGFGWFLDSFDQGTKSGAAVHKHGRPRMWHYGDTMGFKTAIERFTQDRLTVVVLCNRSDVDAAALATRVADVYLGR